MLTDTKTYALYVDIKKAFDSIPHDQLFKCLEAKLPTATRFITFVRNMYNNLYYTVKVGDSFSQIFAQIVGIKQGCNLSPLLFLLYFDEIDSGELNNASETTSTSKFADDLNAYTNTQGEIESMYKRIMVNAKRLRLELNPDKTTITIFHRKGQQFNHTNQIPSHITIGNQRIKVVESTRYLGCILHQHLLLHEMIPIQTFEKRFAIHRRSLTSSSLPLHIKSIIYNREIISKLLHNSPIIGLLLSNIPDVHEINKIYMETIVRTFQEQTKVMCHDILKSSTNTQKMLPYVALQLIPPDITCTTQTTRLITKYINQINTPNNVLRNLIMDNNSIFQVFIKKFINKPLTNVKRSQLKHYECQDQLEGPTINDPDLKLKLPKAPNIKRTDPYMASTLPNEMDFRPFAHHAGIITEDNNNTNNKTTAANLADFMQLFPFKPTPFKFNPSDDILPEIVKHVALLKLVNEASETVTLGHYLNYNIHKDHHVFTQVQTNLNKSHIGWNLLASLRMNIYKPERRFNKKHKKLETVLCPCQPINSQVPKTVWHCLTECPRMNHAKQAAVASTLLIFKKHHLDHIHQLEIEALPEAKTNIDQMKYELINSPYLKRQFIPIIDDPLSHYSQTFLKWHNIRPGVIPSKHWDTRYPQAQLVTKLKRNSYVARWYYNNKVDKYMDLSIWHDLRTQFPIIPNNCHDLDSLIQKITNDQNENFHKLYSTDPQQVPTVIRLYCLVFLAEFLPYINKFTRN